MLTKIELSFKSNTLLTGGLLTKLYELPLEFANMLFRDYSDGVISGMRISTDNGLEVSEGLYKYNGEFFSHDGKIECPEKYESGRHYFLILQPQISERRIDEPNISVIPIAIKVVDRDQLSQIEDQNEEYKLLLKFTGSPRLPQGTETILPDSFDLTPLEHSCRGDKSTYAPQLFELIYKLLQNKDNRHPFDYVIMNEIKSRGVLPQNTIEEYIRCSGRSADDLNRHELIKRFIASIKALKGNAITEKETAQANLGFSQPEQLIIW